MSASVPFPEDPQQEIRVPADRLQTLLAQMLVKNSMFQYDAATVAARLVEADLYGVPSHGCARFVRMLDAICMGDIDPRGRVLTVVDLPALAVLDGSRAAGPVAASKAADLAVEKARSQGIGVVAVGNSQTLCAGEVYLRQMVQHQVIAVCFSSTGGATVTAPGSTAGAVGNCVVSYGAPVQGQSPVIFDSACGEESWGKLELLQRYGLPLPAACLFDGAGDNTEDLSAVKAMRPAGGALGYGLSLLASIVAGPLVGGWMPLHKKRRAAAEDSQHFFLALNIESFGSVEQFHRELGSTLDEIRALSPTDPAHPVRIPGDRGAGCFADYSVNGIPLHHSVAAEIAERASKNKLEVFWDAD